VTPLSFRDPCILFALRREAYGFLREFRPQQVFRDAPCWAWHCEAKGLSVLALQTGIGAARTERALDWVLGQPVLGRVRYQPKLVLSAGFAGALQDGFRVGDVILATEVTNREGRNWPTRWPRELPERKWPQPPHRGRLLTAPAIVSSAKEKRALGREHRAVAVDMETSTVAQVCQERQVTFGCLRVITDDIQTALSPQLVSLLSGERVSALRVLFALLRSPGLAAELACLAKRTRFAATQLAKLLAELLTLT
jgi:uridine phosphorylase